MEEEEKVQNHMNQNLAEKIEELSDKNLNKVIISAGRDRNIIISDPIKMRKLGQITLTNCSNEGYRFTGLRRKEEVWV
jgi:Leucine-rich repeat (LRR) protein